MKARGLQLPILLIIILLAGACMPLAGVNVAPTDVGAAGGKPTSVALTPAAVESTAATSPLATPEPPSAPTIDALGAIDTPGASPMPDATAPAQSTPAGLPAPATPITDTAAVAPTLEAPDMPGLLHMATYRDEVGGFEIDYPADWHLLDVDAAVKQASTGYSITITSWPPQEPGGQGIPDGGSKVDIGVMKGQAATVAEAVEARRAEIAAGHSGGQIVFEEPWELNNGLAAVHWTVQPAQGPLIHEVVTALNGNQVVVSGLGDAALIEEIAMTLRPLGLTATTQQKAAAPAAAELAVRGGGAATATTYIVRAGDTLAKLAARFGVTVQSILAANPQIKNPDRIYIGQRIIIPTSGGSQPTPPPPSGATRVNIYMIGVGDGSVGCGDSVVAVRRDIPKTPAPLTAALNLLLNEKGQYYGESGLYNALYQSNLRIAGISRVGADWTIRLAGSLTLGGVCDAPRVRAQLEQTALQFSTVQSVRYFINGQALETVLSGR